MLTRKIPTLLEHLDNIRRAAERGKHVAENDPNGEKYIDHFLHLLDLTEQVKVCIIPRRKDGKSINVSKP